MDGYFTKDFDLGWVFYNDENDSWFYGDEGNPRNYWEMIRRIGKDDAERAYTYFINNYSSMKLRYVMWQYAESLRNMAKVEREKEDAYMKEISGNTMSSPAGQMFLKHYNEIVQGQKQFSEIINRLIIAIDKGNEGKKNRAPSMSVWFVNYFNESVNNNINNIDLDKLDNDEFWDEFWHKVMEEALDKTFTTFDEKKDPMNGTKEYYKGVADFLKNNPAFYDFLKSYLKLDTVMKFAEEQLKSQGTLKNTNVDHIYQVRKGSYTKKGETFARLIGGLVEEFVGNAKPQIELNPSYKKGRSVSGQVIRSNKGPTDAVLLSQSVVTVDPNKVLDSIQKAANDETQAKIAQNFKDLDKKLNRQKYSDLFVIYTSNKLYAMGKHFEELGGFTKTSNIMNIKQLINQANLGDNLLGTPGRLGQEIIALYLNTTPGAALSDKAHVANIRESLSIIISAVAANLLFSDWYAIGKEYTGARRLHIFDLDGIYVPLSYILEGLAQAMENYGESGVYNGPIEVRNFKTPKNILYPKPPTKDADRYGLEKISKPDDFNQFWLKQREDARSQSEFTIHILTDFKKIIKGIKDQMA